MNDHTYPGFASALADCPLRLPSAASLPAARRARLLDAAAELERCQRALAKAGLNTVGELLKGHDGFYEMNHYPDGDVHDHDSHAQYYYHAHREGAGEHGHFHTFLRGPAIASSRQPPAKGEWPPGEAAIVHLVGVSMDAWGAPIGLFACNRWVTDETWYPSPMLKTLLPLFRVDHAYPCWATNLWLTALLQLFGPHIEALLEHRDQVIARWSERHPGEDALEDRRLEITGQLRIDVDDWRASLVAASDSHLGFGPFGTEISLPPRTDSPHIYETPHAIGLNFEPYGPHSTS